MNTPINNLLYPQIRYRGTLTPENLIFNANLQEFARRVSYICCLETSGKLSPDEAFNELELLWERLKKSHRT